MIYSLHRLSVKLHIRINFVYALFGKYFVSPIDSEYDGKYQFYSENIISNYMENLGSYFTEVNQYKIQSITYK